MTDDDLTWEVERRAGADGVEIRLAGTVTLPGFVRMGTDLMERGELSHLAYLWDFRNADLSQLRLEDVRRIWAAQSRTPEAPALEVRRAMVVAREVDFAILRQALMTSPIPTEEYWRVFRDIDAARAWLDGE